MFDKFAEYIYYLLPTPFKRIKKTLNNWFKLAKVIGNLFDDAKETLVKARSESMITTCSDIMLKEHAADRGLKRYESDNELTRYDGETYDNFRKRIAMYLDVCKLAGTNEGMIKAVRSLGYKSVEFKLAKELRNDPSRWAEFYVIITMNIDENFQIHFNILRKEVRKIKEVGAKDNYLFRLNNRITTCCEIIPSSTTRLQTIHINDILNKTVVRIITNTTNNISHTYIRNRSYDAWYFNGKYNFDGTRVADSIDYREEL